MKKYPKNTKNLDWEKKTTGKNTPEWMIKRYAQELTSVNLETHSGCNFSAMHCKQCPVAARTELFGDFILDLKVIERFIKDLNSLGYTGTTFFHSYNEPLMDKRIFKIIEMHKKLCPKAKTGILSNGKILTKKIAEELIESGVDVIQVSSYAIQDPKDVGFDEYIRIKQIIDDLKIKYPSGTFDIDHMILDDRMNFYEYGWTNPGPGRDENGLQPCYRPAKQLVIASSGDIQLCCYEWKKENKFGNINKNSLIEILENSDFLLVREDLITGMRDKYYPCDRCF